jgi:FkbM family methyltransferase
MVEDLIFDLGMHNGDDTALYLDRGYRVVAVEANPVLVIAAKERFAAAIAHGRLAIEACAVSNCEGTASFWVNDEKSEWSALDRELGGRLGTESHEIRVPCMRLSTIFQKYGVPFFLKSDIEKGDRYALAELNPGDLPRYIAVEAHDFDYLLMLWNYGYRQFKMVDQMRINSSFPLLSNEHFHTRLLKRGFWYADRIKNKFVRSLKYKPGSSGPLSEEAEGQWVRIEDVAYDFLHHLNKYQDRGTMDPFSWFDLHAKLG